MYSLLTCSFSLLPLAALFIYIFIYLFQAGTDLVYFLFIFLVVFFGFVMMAHLTFGADIAVFSSFLEAVGSCWQFIIGNPPSFDSLFSTNRVLGPIVCYTTLHVTSTSSYNFPVLFTVHGVHLLCAGEHVHCDRDQCIY